MTTSLPHSLMLGFAIFLGIEAILLLATGRGLMERAMPGELGDDGRRRSMALVYFLMVGLLLFLWWRGE